MPGDTTESYATFRFDGRFDVGHLRDDETLTAGENGSAVVSRIDDRTGVGDVIVEEGDWFARYDDEVGTPFVIPGAVAKTIHDRACPHD